MNERSFSGILPLLFFLQKIGLIMRQPETDMAEQIFLATERLMATGGLHSLSMHKIAKEAQISSGTIYLYFKSKDELLEQLALRVFSTFSAALAQNYDENQSYFAQYRTMWWNIWQLLQSNPTTLKNLDQYLSLPNFLNLCREQENNSHWDLFYRKATADNQLCDLPSQVLFSLSLESAINLARDQHYFEQIFSAEILENVIERTWRAIQK